MQPLENAVSERSVARVDAFNIPLGEAPVIEPAVVEHVSTAPIPGAAVSDEAFALTPPHNPGQMRVTKRNGGQEIVDVNKIAESHAKKRYGRQL